MVSRQSRRDETGAQQMTTTTTKTVKIKTVNVGQNFGTIGVLVARNGRRIAETEAYPYGFESAARAGAEALAAKMGLAALGDMQMFTISFADGSSDEEFDTQEQAEAHLDAVLDEGYELEYFEDRALFWASAEESINDDGARALGSIRWQDGDR